MESLVISTGLVLPRSNISSPTKNKTQEAEAILESLFFAQSKSIRTSTIILATFNTLIALTTVVRIAYDCYWASRKYNYKVKKTGFHIPWIHPAETFPLVLSLGIMVQGMVFAGAQGMGLKALNEHGCAHISQFVWPALFIVPYIQLVFGVECTIRSTRALPFPPRRRYDIWICLGLVVLMLLGTWIPSHIHPERDFCFASLLWFISRFGMDAFILLSVCAVLILVCAVTIFFRLARGKSIDHDQRIAASRMVYYLVMAFVSLAFVIPFFASLALKKANAKASMMATVVVNLSGLMSALLHLFLRSNATITSFGPRTERSRWNQKKRQFTMWGPNDLDLGKRMLGQGSPNRRESRPNSRSSLVGREKGSAGLANFQTSEIGSPAQVDFAATATNCVTSNSPTVPAPVAERTLTSLQRTSSRKRSYSLFPTAAALAAQGQPTLDVTPESPTPLDSALLEPPPRIFAEHGGLRVPNHRRDSSIVSSATVQIGLRLSHARTPSQAELMSQSLSAATYQPPQPVAPLRIQKGMSNPPPLPATRFPVRPSPPQLAAEDNSRVAINKTLPPTPYPQPKLAPSQETIRLSDIKLSPAVYKPESPKKSPRPRKDTLEPPASATLKDASPTERLGPSQQDWI
ncbi:hypothetical protein F5884DRAFT_850642 [Xylogone sp. PMI_703]|nr:hypothetical protein F5884DRAFT_850642 [Xylogone sp. PMI_703]